MIIAGKEYKKEIPFRNVYLTGIVRDKLGRKMSKSLGNSPEPLDLIRKYGADGVRVGMLLCSPAGNDLPFDESYCEQGRNFWNKLWNAFRLTKGWSISSDVKQTEASSASILWFESRLHEQIASIDDLFSKYRISEALMSTYKLVWDDFCSWYLEAVKPEFIDGIAQPIDKKTYEQTQYFFEIILKLLHPFMPFITEELWHLMKERAADDFLIVSDWPVPGKYDHHTVSDFEKAKEIVSQIRMIRQQKNISPKDKLSLNFIQMKGSPVKLFFPVVIKLANLSLVEQVTSKVSNSAGFVTGDAEFFLQLGDKIDLVAERDRILKDIAYHEGFLKSVSAKLSNEKFVSNAKPEVVENERKKQADAQAKIRVLEEQLAAL